LQDLRITKKTPVLPGEKNPRWPDLDLLLELPKGSARPARIAVDLWDNGLTHHDDAPLAESLVGFEQI
jgi:hypothetical protein